MAAMSDYLEVELRKHLFRTGSFTKPTALYIALYTTPTTDAGGGTEVTGGSYARVNLPPSDANWTAASATDGATDNAVEVLFPTATLAWGTVTHVAILDAPSGGNMILHGVLGASKTIDAGDTFRFAPGELDTTFA